MRQEPRLQFTKEERAAPELEKPIRKADRAADKAEKARAKIPKKKIRFEETVTDPATGKTVTRLRFEEVDKKKAALQAVPCGTGRAWERGPLQSTQGNPGV